MKPLEQVWDAVNFFTAKPKHVFIDLDAAKKVAEEIKKTEIEPFPRPAWAKKNEVFVAYHLIASSVNYCYWYGSGDFRPNNSSSSKMYKLLDDAFAENYSGYPYLIHEVCADFCNKLKRERFPLAKKRQEHIDELKDQLEDNLDKIASFKGSIDDALEMVLVYPGFSEDVFLKRASLFLLLIGNDLGWSEEEMNRLPVPADYQVPKMLAHLNVLNYSLELRTAIRNNDLIPSGSRMECELRAATILSCKHISQMAERHIGRVDQYLWGWRKTCLDPFHLTLTTDY